MRNQELIKVAGFVSSLKDSLSSDNPERGRMLHAGLGGAAGAGAGAWLGYNRALNQAMADPFRNLDVFGHIGSKPGVMETLLADAPTNMAGRLKEFGRTHGSMFPSVAKLRTSKLLIPAAGLGGLGALLGALIPGSQQAPKNRMEKLWERRPDLLR